MQIEIVYYALALVVLTYVPYYIVIRPELERRRKERAKRETNRLIIGAMVEAKVAPETIAKAEEYLSQR